MRGGRGGMCAESDVECDSVKIERDHQTPEKDLNKEGNVLQRRRLRIRISHGGCDFSRRC